MGFDPKDHKGYDPTDYYMSSEHARGLLSLEEKTVEQLRMQGRLQAVLKDDEWRYDTLSVMGFRVESLLHDLSLKVRDEKIHELISELLLLQYRRGFMSANEDTAQKLFSSTMKDTVKDGSEDKK